MLYRLKMALVVYIKYSLPGYHLQHRMMLKVRLRIMSHQVLSSSMFYLLWHHLSLASLPSPEVWYLVWLSSAFWKSGAPRFGSSQVFPFTSIQSFKTHYKYSFSQKDMLFSGRFRCPCEYSPVIPCYVLYLIIIL